MFSFSGKRFAPDCVGAVIQTLEQTTWRPPLIHRPPVNLGQIPRWLFPTLHLRGRTRLQLWLLLGLSLLINGLVLFNAAFHPPLVGYDAHDHTAYVLTLGSGRLPTPSDTFEFFSPPLPYLLPALAHATGRFSPGAAAKLGQLQNVLLSLATTYLLIHLCRRLAPTRPFLPILALLLLGTMTVYYKSFTFLRGEPWLVVFTLLLANELVDLDKERVHSMRSAVRSGLWMALALLSRQWAFMLIPAYLLWTAVQQGLLSIHQTLPVWLERAKGLMKIWLVSGFVVLLLSGWFYAHLYLRYGSIAAFNRTPYATLSLHNQPPSFFSGTGNGKLFTEPVRPSFPAQLWPKFYSELWGDYEAYFLVYGVDRRNNELLAGFELEETSGPFLLSNREQLLPYLARVNRLAIGVSVILLAGLGSGVAALGRWLRSRAMGHGRPFPSAATAPYALIILLAVVGYAYFLVRYPHPGNGDTIKATYLLHTYPLLAILSAQWLDSLSRHKPFAFLLLVSVVVLTFLYLLPAFISRYALLLLG